MSTSEVEEILYSKKKVYRIARGDVKGEDIYLALGKTDSGRYITVFFILKKKKGYFSALPISARDMDTKERRRYKHG